MRVTKGRIGIAETQWIRRLIRGDRPTQHIAYKEDRRPEIGIVNGHIPRPLQ